MHTTARHLLWTLGQSGTWKDGDNDKLTDNKLPKVTELARIRTKLPDLQAHALFHSCLLRKLLGAVGVKSVTWKFTSTWNLRKWLYIKLGLCGCNYGKDCDEVTLCPKSNECPHKRKKRTHTEKTMQKWKQSDGSASSGMPRTSDGWPTLEVWKGFYPQNLPKEPTLLTAWFQIVASRTVRNTLLLF